MLKHAIYGMFLILILGCCCFGIKAINLIPKVIIWYILPVTALLSYISKKMIDVFVIYGFSLAANFIIFNAAVTVPNYCIIVFVLLLYFAKVIGEHLDFLNSKNRVMLYSMIAFGIMYFAGFNYQNIFFLSPKDTFHRVLVLKDVKYSNSPFIYTGKDDADCAKLNAIKGNRISYSILPNIQDETMKYTSMSMRFLPIGYNKCVKK